MSLEPRTDDPAITQAAVTCKIIAGALVFGVVAFAAVVVVLRLGRQPGGTLISFVAVGFAAAMIVVRQFVLGIAGGRTGPPQPGPAGPLALYQTRMIIGLAILEGAAFFNCIAYLLEGRWWTLLAVAVLVARMLASFPTRTRLRQWVADREQLKTFGPDGT